MYQYEIIIGDWSGDGHGRTEKFIINCSHPASAMNDSYLTFCNQTNLSLHQNKKYKVLLEEYEDNKILAADLEKLKQAGINLDFLETCDYIDGDVQLWDPKKVVYLMMAMIKIHLPKFEYKIVEPKQFHLGKNKSGYVGYGIFP